MGQKITKEEAKKKLADAKEEAKAARSEMRAFEKENDLAKDTDHAGHEKLGKKWSKLKEAFDKKQKKVDEATASLAEVKKDKTPRPSKYEYPKGEGGKEMTAAEKKKYRAKMRAEAKRKEKGDAKAEKKEKKSSKKEGKEAKAEKKAKKEPVEVED